jgi:hypothetical protein
VYLLRRNDLKWEENAEEQIVKEQLEKEEELLGKEQENNKYLKTT